MIRTTLLFLCIIWPLHAANIRRILNMSSSHEAVICCTNAAYVEWFYTLQPSSSVMVNHSVPIVTRIPRHFDGEFSYDVRIDKCQHVISIACNKKYYYVVQSSAPLHLSRSEMCGIWMGTASSYWLVVPYDSILPTVDYEILIYADRSPIFSRITY